MKKNVRNLIALGIALNIAYAGIMPAYAAVNSTSQNKTLSESITKTYNTSTNKPVIRCETLIQKAQDTSGKLSLKSDEIAMYKKQMKTQEKLDDEVGASELGTLKSDYAEYFVERTSEYYIDRYKINIDEAKRDTEYMKDKIARDIRDKYEEIVLMEIQISRTQKLLSVSSNTSMYAGVNVSTGYGTENTKLAADIQVKKLKNDLTSMQNLLKNKKDYLGVLTDTDLSQYSFDYNLSYAPITINNEDAYFDDLINEYLSYKNKLLDLSKDYRDDLKDDVDSSPDEPTEPAKPNFSAISTLMNTQWSLLANEQGEAYVKNKADELAKQTKKYLEYTKEYIKYVQELNSYMKYLEINYSVQSSQVQLDDARKTMKNKLEEAYTSLKSLESQIDLMNDQFLYVNNNLLYAKVQRDTGMMTENDYNDKVAQAEELELGLRQLVNGYNKLKDVVQQPWIALDE